MDITNLDVQALKALAYDELAKIQVGQANLQAINAEIQKRNAPVEPVEEANEAAK